MTNRLTIVQTHPVQYMAPWFRDMATAQTGIDLTVLYASTPMPSQQGVGFNESFAWDVGLTDGYTHKVLAEPHPDRKFDSGSFKGADVEGVGDAILATRPDAVIVPGWHSMFYLRAIAACRRANIPVLYRGDTNLLVAPRGIRRLPWSIRTRAALKMFDGYLSVGTRSREYLRHFGAPEPLIFDSPHCVDNTQFASGAGSDGTREQARKEMGAGPGDFLVFFAGKFLENKRPLDVIEAAARLGSDVVVAMAGNGPLIETMREATGRFNVRVTWCGFLNQSAMPRALAAADCVAVPSASESWGLIVNEALAAGTPCVVSSGVGAAADLIAADSTGVVHEPGDISGLAASLLRVREALGSGRITADTCRRAVAPFSFEHATDGVVAAIRRVDARKRASPAHAGHPRVLAAFGNMAMVSGVERMSFEVLRTLRECGAAVHCIVNSWESSKVVDLVDSVGASWSMGYYWYELRRRAAPHQRLLALWDICRTSLDLLQDARRFRPTHVFTPEYHAVLRSAPALWLARRAGVRVVLRLGNAPEPGRFYRFLWGRVIDRCVDRYVPNSRFIEQELLAHGIDRAKVRVIYNTVPYRASDWGAARPVAGRIIYVGQIIPPKGLDVLLDAVALLVQRGYNPTLDVVGAVDGWEAPGYGGYRERIRQRVGAADLAGRVRLLGQREDVPALMAAASVHCMPSRLEQKEGFAVTALEAKRAGLPSVVTHSGALPEMIRHTVDGWVCPDVTSAAIAEGLAYFLDDPDRARMAGEQARASERLYNRERFAAEWADIFSASSHAVPARVRAHSS